MEAAVLRVNSTPVDAESDVNGESDFDSGG